MSELDDSEVIGPCVLCGTEVRSVPGLGLLPLETAGAEATHTTTVCALRAALATETATRTALRTQESRISGLLADAGLPVGDLVEGVERLVRERDEARAALDRMDQRELALMEAVEVCEAVGREFAASKVHASTNDVINAITARILVYRDIKPENSRAAGRAEGLREAAAIRALLDKVQP